MNHPVATASRLLTEQATALPAGLTARMLHPVDSDMIRSFRRAVIATLADPDHYNIAGEVGDFVLDHLGPRGLTAGIFHGETLVAYGAIGLPGPGDPNRGIDMGLPESEWGQVAHMASAMAAPDMRGRGLHHWLIDWRIAVADAFGKRHLLTTVSTRNHASWGNLATHGLHPKRRLTIGPGLIRFLVHRDARDNQALDPQTARLVPFEELAEAPLLFDNQQRIWRREKTEQGWSAVVGRPKQHNGALQSEL